MAWTIYLISVLECIGIVSIIGTFCASIVCGAIWFIRENEYDDDKVGKYSILLKRWCIVAITCLCLSITIPSKKTMYTMWGLGTIGQVVKENKTLQELPEKSLNALNTWLDSLNNQE